MSLLGALDISLDTIKRSIDGIRDFLRISLCIANAHTVDFYTRNLWNLFIALSADSVLSVINDTRCGQRRAPAEKHEGPFGFSKDSRRLEDVDALLEAASAHSLPALGICVSLSELLKALPVRGVTTQPNNDVMLETDEFMNSKKSHEVQIMSGVVAGLAQQCHVRQVVDVGSGKGYLCSFLSMQYGLKVYGIDASSTNTHGACERNRKLKKYSKAYQRHARQKALGSDPSSREGNESKVKETVQSAGYSPSAGPKAVSGTGLDEPLLDPVSPDPQDPFLSLLSPEAAELPTTRVPPCELSEEERERRKLENLERKAWGRKEDILYSPVTSYVTAETELREIITELEDAVVVGLHTCGDLAPSTLRMFAAKRELRALCSVACCYHLLSEEFDCPGRECPAGGWGFPMSRHLRDQRWFCGRNARMTACLALERVAVGQGLPGESLFFRAVLHVILRDHYDAFKSDKRVGNVFSKATSFVDYVRKALRKLELDDSKLSDTLIQSYHDTYLPRKKEMEAFNMLKVSLAPCIEGLILLDRLCYLKEQDQELSCVLVQLFDPLMSPRCYGIVSVKEAQTA